MRLVNAMLGKAVKRQVNPPPCDVHPQVLPKINQLQRGTNAVALRKRLGISDSRSFLKLLNQLSVGALSQQLPLRLIEQIMLYFLSFL